MSILPIKAPAGRALQTTKAVTGTHPNDLDEQIRAAEQAVIDGRERAFLHADQLVDRVRAQMSRGAGYGLAIAAAALLISRLRRPTQHDATPAVTRPAKSALATVLPLLWQLLPGAWRRTLPDAVSPLVFGVVFPALGRLFRRAKPSSAGAQTSDSRR